MVKVLVVDDSTFFRKRLTEIVNKDKDLELVGEAQNGKDAVALVASLRPDVVTMDVEMPIMNGIEAVREIMKKTPTPVLMFSSLTHDGAKATLDALDAGAMDFIPKNFDDIARKKEDAIRLITDKLKELGRIGTRGMRKVSSFSYDDPVKTTHTSSVGLHHSVGSSSSLHTDSRLSTLRTGLTHASTLGARTTSSLGATSTASRFGSNRTTTTQSSLLNRQSSLGVKSNDDVAKKMQTVRRVSSKYKILTIGTSTGGPLALQTVLTEIPQDFPIPIVVIQHMPEAFTGPFAQRLNRLCPLNVVEAKDGDHPYAGTIYIAPGAKQLMIAKDANNEPVIKIVPSPDNIIYKPSVDITFGSASQVYGNKVLAVVLTGMGNDGAKGASLLKRAGSIIWAQDEKSCVIYGMPKAIVEGGLASKVLPIGDFASELVNEVCK